VHGAARGVGKRLARQMRSDGHVIARRGVPRLAADHFQRAPDAPRRFQGQSTRQGRGHPGDESLNDMNERVNPRSRRDLGGQAIRKRQVHDGDVREDARIHKAHFVPRGRVGKQGDERIRFVRLPK